MHRTEYARLSDRIEAKRVQFANAQRETIMHPGDDEMLQYERMISEQYNNLLRNETKLMHQKTKVEWI